MGSQKIGQQLGEGWRGARGPRLLELTEDLVRAEDFDQSVRLAARVLSEVLNLKRKMPEGMSPTHYYILESNLIPSGKPVLGGEDSVVKIVKSFSGPLESLGITVEHLLFTRRTFGHCLWLDSVDRWCTLPNSEAQEATPSEIHLHFSRAESNETDFIFRSLFRWVPDRLQKQNLASCFLRPRFDKSWGFFVDIGIPDGRFPYSFLIQTIDRRRLEPMTESFVGKLPSLNAERSNKKFALACLLYGFGPVPWHDLNFSAGESKNGKIVLYRETEEHRGKRTLSILWDGTHDYSYDLPPGVEESRVRLTVESEHLSAQHGTIQVFTASTKPAHLMDLVCAPLEGVAFTRAYWNPNRCSANPNGRAKIIADVSLIFDRGLQDTLPLPRLPLIPISTSTIPSGTVRRFVPFGNQFQIRENVRFNLANAHYIRGKEKVLGVGVYPPGADPSHMEPYLILERRDGDWIASPSIDAKLITRELREKVETAIKINLSIYLGENPRDPDKAQRDLFAMGEQNPNTFYRVVNEELKKFDSKNSSSQRPKVEYIQDYATHIYLASLLRDWTTLLQMMNQFHVGSPTPPIEALRATHPNELHQAILRMRSQTIQAFQGDVDTFIKWHC